MRLCFGVWWKFPEELFDCHPYAYIFSIFVLSQYFLQLPSSLFLRLSHFIIIFLFLYFLFSLLEILLIRAFRVKSLVDISSIQIERLSVSSKTQSLTSRLSIGGWKPADTISLLIQSFDVNFHMFLRPSHESNLHKPFVIESFGFTAQKHDFSAEESWYWLKFD